MSKCCNKPKVNLPKTCVCPVPKKEPAEVPDIMNSILSPNVEAEASEVRNDIDQEDNE